MKLLIDMNLSPRWGGVLIDAGFPAIHWSSVGPPNARDIEIMTWAAAHDHVVLTHDLDFGTILSAIRTEKPSVVQLRAEDVSPNAIAAIVSPNAIAAIVVAALRQMESELGEGALLVIDPGRTRLRLLPLSGRSGRGDSVN